MKKFFTLTAILVMGILSINTCSANEKITIVFDNANPPFMYSESEQKTAKGLYPLIIEKVFEKIGVSVVLEAYPWKRAIMMGEKGMVGIGGIYKNEKRLEIFDYTNPLYSENINIYSIEGKEFTFEKMLDLKGKKIGIMNGWSYGDEFDKMKIEGAFKTEENVSDVANAKKMAVGRLDCLLMAEESEYLIPNEIKIKKIATMIINESFVVFKKGTGSEPLIKNFNEALEKMKTDGSYKSLIENFLKTK